MKTFLWLLLGAGLIAAYIYTDNPEFRGMMREKYPALAFMFKEPGSGDGDGGVATIRVKPEKLVGAWRAEDGSELLFFREDGKFRSALAAEFRSNSATEVLQSVYISAVMLGDYTVEAPGKIQTSNIQISGYRARKMQLDLGRARKFDTSADEMEETAKYRRMLPDLLRRDFDSWVKGGNLGGGVTRLSKDTLVLYRPDGLVTFKKIDPAGARDPNENGRRVLTSPTVVQLIEEPATRDPQASKLTQPR